MVFTSPWLTHLAPRGTGQSLAGLDRNGASGTHFEILGADEGVTRATIDVSSADFARWFKGGGEVRAGRPEFCKRRIAGA
jgi:hypothetical protein